MKKHMRVRDEYLWLFYPKKTAPKADERFASQVLAAWVDKGCLALFDAWVDRSCLDLPGKFDAWGDSIGLGRLGVWTSVILVLVEFNVGLLNLDLFGARDGEGLKLTASVEKVGLGLDTSSRLDTGDLKWSLWAIIACLTLDRSASKVSSSDSEDDIARACLLLFTCSRTDWL